MKPPNFFILGAPKCGTSALAMWLGQHRDVFMAAHKEPHHFNIDMAHRNFADRRRYERLFRDADGRQAVGEASVWYLYSNEAVPNIESYAEEPRYIVCVRNPVDMAYSLHQQQVFSGNEDQADFAVAWSLAEQRRAGQAVPAAAVDKTTLIYPDACALGSQMERLHSRVPAERVHVVLMEDLRGDARGIFEGVQRFLTLAPDPNITLPVVNAAKVRKSLALQRLSHQLGRAKASLGVTKSFGLLTQLDEINRADGRREPLEPTLRAKLIEHFRPEVDLLECVLGRDLSALKK